MEPPHAAASCSDPLEQSTPAAAARCHTLPHVATCCRSRSPSEPLPMEPPHAAASCSDPLEQSTPAAAARCHTLPEPLPFGASAFNWSLPYGASPWSLGASSLKPDLLPYGASAPTTGAALCSPSTFNPEPLPYGASTLQLDSPHYGASTQPCSPCCPCSPCSLCQHDRAKPPSQLNSPAVVQHQTPRVLDRSSNDPVIQAASTSFRRFGRSAFGPFAGGGYCGRRPSSSSSTSLRLPYVTSVESLLPSCLIYILSFLFHPS